MSSCSLAGCWNAINSAASHHDVSRQALRVLKAELSVLNSPFEGDPARAQRARICYSASQRAGELETLVHVFRQSPAGASTFQEELNVS